MPAITPHKKSRRQINPAIRQNEHTKPPHRAHIRQFSSSIQKNSSLPRRRFSPPRITLQTITTGVHNALNQNLSGHRLPLQRGNEYIDDDDDDDGGGGGAHHYSQHHHYNNSFDSGDIPFEYSSLPHLLHHDLAALNNCKMTTPPTPPIQQQLQQLQQPQQQHKPKQHDSYNHPHPTAINTTSTAQRATTIIINTTNTVPNTAISPYNTTRRHFFSFGKKSPGQIEGRDKDNNNATILMSTTGSPTVNETDTMILQPHRKFSNSATTTTTTATTTTPGIIPLNKFHPQQPETEEELNDKRSMFWNMVYDYTLGRSAEGKAKFEQIQTITEGKRVLAEQKMKELAMVLGQKHREQQILYDIEMRKNENILKELSSRVFDFCTPKDEHDRMGVEPDRIGTRHEYSNLQPLLIPSNEFPSLLQEDLNKVLTKTGAKRWTDMLIELKDDFVDYLNKKEPFGQRKKDRKYRLKNRLNKPYARYELNEDDMDDDALPVEAFHEFNTNYHRMRLENERRAIELKRKARVAMGLEPDLELERRWYEITGDRGAVPNKLNAKAQQATDFEIFRQQYLDNFGQNKYRKKITVPLTGDAKKKKKKHRPYATQLDGTKTKGQLLDDNTDPEGYTDGEEEEEEVELDEGEYAPGDRKGAKNLEFNDKGEAWSDGEMLNNVKNDELESYRWPLHEDILKSRRQIYDPVDGLPMWRDDLLGLTRSAAARMPADEEDLDFYEQQHWRRKIKQAMKKKYFKGGYKFDLWQGAGPKVIAPLAPARNRGRTPRRKWRVVKYGFGGMRGPRSPHLIYDYIYGRRIKTVRGHGGVTSVGLFQKFPHIFTTRQPDVPWDGTTALTYSPEQNHITKWELRRQTLRFKLSMSPLGDLSRGLWKLYNVDVFPFTHFRYPVGWILGHFKWLWGYRNALARWSKTATHAFIDERFAYQMNRYGEHQNKDIYHYANEYDYLKEYQLPIVVRAIREYDFDVLRSACSKHALFCILKYLHLQERFGVFTEYRRNYWIESLDIREVRKNEHGKIILNIEFVLVEPPYYYNRAGGKIFHEKAQYKGLYKPQPLVMNMTLLRDYDHPDFDYEVIDFQADARRVKRVFNNIERMYHSAQRSRTQYFKAPKFYAVRRTAVETPFYNRRSRVVNAYKAQVETPTFRERELEFSFDMENKHNEMIKYRDTLQLGKYITALQLEPIFDYMVAETKQHPAFTLHPIQKDRKLYWEQRKELDLVKFRQREARRVRAQQNTLHRYYHKLRTVAHFKHTYDHGGDFREFRRLHIDKLAIDANHDDWVQKWLVDPERSARPIFKNKDRFALKIRPHLLRKRRKKFQKTVNRRWMRTEKFKARFNKITLASKRRKHRNIRYRQAKRRKYQIRLQKLGHGRSKKVWKKRRRFLPYMERVYHRMPRGVFSEYRKFFRSRNHRVNMFKGRTTMFSSKQKGPGYTMYDTTWFEKQHVWDGGYYNPNEDCYTRADVFNPKNDPFEPRRNYLLSFMDDNTIRIPYYANRDWDLPWRLVYQGFWRKEMSLKRGRVKAARLQKIAAPHLRNALRKRDRMRFSHLPNAEAYEENDDAQWAHQDDLNRWPKPDDDKWKI